MILVLALAGAASADVISASEGLMAAARRGSAESWLRRWTPDDGRRLQWRQVLASDSATVSTLRHARGVLHISEGPDYQRAVLDTLPPLSLVMRGEQAVTLEPTTCVDCGERERFVLDLLAEVGRYGSLRDRLLPGVELDITTAMAEEPRLRSEHWPSMIALRHATDRALATRLAGATVVGVEDDVVTLRLPDGRADTWAVVWREGRWLIDYTRLAEDSPLRLDRSAARRWRYISTRQEALVEGWTPSWHTVAGGVGERVAQDASLARFDPWDDTVWVVMHELDPAETAVFHVDPIAQTVLARHPLPARSLRGNWRAGPWRERWRAALSPNGHAMLLTGHSGVWVLDTRTGKRVTVGNSREVSAVAWGTGAASGQVAWGREAGEVYVTNAEGRRRELSAGIWTLGLVTDGATTSAVGTDGRVLLWQGDDRKPETFARTCGGEATAASARPDGAWLVVCGPRANRTWEVHGPLGGPGEYGGYQGAGGTVAAWNPDGTELLTASPEGVGAVLWDLRSEQPLLAFGYRAFREASFNSTGDRILTVDDAGDVVVWDVARLRARHAIVVDP
jgi:hypothetical protein